MMYAQKDPRWANRKLGNGPGTIGSAGCLLCCIAGALADFYGEPEAMDPVRLNSLLLEVGGFSRDDLIWDRLRLVEPALRMTREDWSARSFSREAAEQVERWVAQPPPLGGKRYLVVGVDSDPVGRPGRQQHWTLLRRVLDPHVPEGVRADRGREGLEGYRRWVVWDPLYGSEVVLNWFGAPAGRRLDYAVWALVRIEIDPMHFIGHCRLSEPMFAQILGKAGSPMALVARQIYGVLRGFELDPAVALAMAEHESRFGREGVAVRTHNPWNLRSARVPEEADEVKEGWAWFRRRDGESDGDEYVRAARAYARLMRVTYHDEWGFRTLEGALLRYAPSADGNAPLAYGDAVRGRVIGWMQG